MIRLGKSIRSCRKRQMRLAALSLLFLCVDASALPETSQRMPTGAAPEPTVRLRRTRPEIPTSLLRGYDRLQSGDIDGARRDYEDALRLDPKNADALLGLAVIARHQGRNADANDLYQSILEADPTNAAAQGAIASLAASMDPIGSESRLKGLIAAQPQATPLHFSLGNLYARQQRWREAQQAYLNAAVADGDNPDYLFNLAVSLDHLRQSAVAADYYRRALEAAGRRPAGFKQEQARSRFEVLQPWSEENPR